MKYRPAFFEFMTIQDREFAQDLPDGAWQAFMQEQVTAYNKANGTNYDPFDGWLDWCKWTGQ